MDNGNTNNGNMNLNEYSINRLLAIFSHAIGFIPISGIFWPYIILLVSKDEYVRKHAKNALNWQLSFFIYYIISMLLVVVLIGLLITPVLIVAHIVFCVMAAVKASNNIVWKYPLAIPFIK